MPTIRFQIATAQGWQEEQTTFSKNFPEPFDSPITNFKIEGDGIYKARVRNAKGKWLDYKDTYEPLGDDTPIIEMEIVGYGYVVAAHTTGFWLNPESIDYNEGSRIIGLAYPIDAIWIQSLS